MREQPQQKYKIDDTQLSALERLAGDTIREHEQSGGAPIILGPLHNIIDKARYGTISYDEAITQIKELNENSGDRD